MYVTPTLAPVDLTVTAASCCRVIVGTGNKELQIVNEPLCPFPAPTGDICVVSSGSSVLPGAHVCALAN